MALARTAEEGEESRQFPRPCRIQSYHLLSFRIRSCLWDVACARNPAAVLLEALHGLGMESLRSWTSPMTRSLLGRALASTGQHYCGYSLLDYWGRQHTSPTRQ